MFVGVVAGVMLSFYIDFVTGAAVMLGACLAMLMLKYKKMAVVLAVMLCAFTRTYFFYPTKAQVNNAENMGVPVVAYELVEYEFVFQEYVDFIRAIPKKVLGKERGAYVSGVMFGDKSDLDTETKQAFRGAGISHILAVSGLHVGILITIVNFALKGLKSKIRIPIKCLFIAVLVIASGFSPSVLRASLMAGIYIVADATGHRYNMLNSLFLAGCIILMAVPYHLFNVGFLLSFSATLGIGLFYPYLYEKVKSLGEWLGGGIAMYIACQLGSLPILILVFNELSLLGLMGNLLTVPIVSFALGFALIGLLLYPVGLSYYFLSYSAAFMEMIEYVAVGISNMPFSAVQMGSVPSLAVIIYYGAVGLLCVCVFHKRTSVYLTMIMAMSVMLTCGLISF